MKKLLLLIMVSAGLSAGIFPPTNEGDVTQNVNVDVVVNTPTVQGEQGIQGVKGDTGTTTLMIVENDTGELYKRIQASSNALSSVELNPDHEGLSLSVGYSKVVGINAGAAGVMYAWKVGETTTVGVNVKGYKAEGGHKGASGGITVGF